MCDEFGFKSIKLKGGVLPAREEADAMLALHEAFGPGTPLRLDPNAIWTVETPFAIGKRLEGMLEYYEDPARGQENMAAVRQALKIPLATNMCTTSFDDIPGSVRLGSEDIILSDHHFWGGLRASVELARICAPLAAGSPCTPTATSASRWPPWRTSPPPRPTSPMPATPTTPGNRKR